MTTPTPQDHVRMILVEFCPAALEFSVQEVSVRPKRAPIEKILACEAKTENVPLLHVFPGHSMRALRDEFYGKLQKWTFSKPEGCLDVFFEGPALIYGMTKSQISPCTLSRDEVYAALTDVHL